MAVIGEMCVGGLSCCFIFLKYGHIVKRCFQNRYVWKVLWGRKRHLSSLRSQLLHIIHLVHCRVNVPANRTPLCRLSRQDTFILLWMDRITYSRPLCFRGEGDQTSNYCMVDLGPFNCLTKDFFSLEMEQFPGTFTVWCIIMSEFQLLSQPSLGWLPWQQPSRALINVCIQYVWVCVWEKETDCVSVWINVCICMHMYSCVCEYEKKHAEVICWSSEPYQFTWKPITAEAEESVSSRAKNKRDAEERVTMKRWQNWMDECWDAAQWIIWGACVLW